MICNYKDKIFEFDKIDDQSGRQNEPQKYG